MKYLAWALAAALIITAAVSCHRRAEAPKAPPAVVQVQADEPAELQERFDALPQAQPTPPAPQVLIAPIKRHVVVKHVVKKPRVVIKHKKAVVRPAPLPPVAEAEPEVPQQRYVPCLFIIPCTPEPAGRMP